MKGQPSPALFPSAAGRVSRWHILLLADVVISLPVFLYACWAAFINPFVGEKIGMIIIAVAALLVMLPSVLLLNRRALTNATAWAFSLFYGVMLLVVGYILLYDSTYGPEWWRLTLAACLCTIGKSVVVAFMLAK